MEAILHVLSFFARRPSMNTVSNFFTANLARLTIRQKDIREATSLQELGATWQQSFAAKKLIPVTGTDDNTVYAEIRINCPLKGSGDTMACYRMMNFDRKILEEAGGQFIVLESQAVPGVQHCKVAMRFKDQPVDDLVPAHLKPSGSAANESQ